MKMKRGHDRRDSLAILAAGFCIVALAGCSSSTPLSKLTGSWHGVDRPAPKYCDVRAVAGVNGGKPVIGPCTVQVDWTVLDKLMVNHDGHVSIDYHYDSGPGVPYGTSAKVDPAEAKPGSCNATVTVGGAWLKLAGTACHVASGDKSPVNVDALRPTVTWTLDGECLTITSNQSLNATSRFERTKGGCKGPDPTYLKFGMGEEINTAS